MKAIVKLECPHCEDAVRVKARAGWYVVQVRLLGRWAEPWEEYRTREHAEARARRMMDQHVAAYHKGAVA